MPRNGALFVANTTSDTVSVIDTRKDAVVQTIATQPWPKAKVGYEPTGIDADEGRPPAGHPRPGERGRGLPLRRDAAGAGQLRRPAADRLLPVRVATVGNEVVVTNTRGIDARGPDHHEQGHGVPASGHDTHSTTAS